jgi:hypothetical protein
MEERMLEEDEKTSGSKERRQESRRSPCIESVGKVRSQGLSFLYTKKYRQVRPQDLDNGNVHEIRSTRSRDGDGKRDTDCVNTVASKILCQAPLQSPVARPVLPSSGEISTSPATRPRKRTRTRMVESDVAVCR